MADNELVQAVKNGTFTENTAITSTQAVENTRGTTNLGKDAFLQLLVAEMQNQDPLEPSSNTEWISQLATFSQLEELQSLSETSQNSQIFSLVGKQVIIQTENSDGTKSLKSGMVDFVSFSGGSAKFSVNDNLYDMSNLYSIIDSDYFYDQNKPKLKGEQIEFSFNGDEPENLAFEVEMGSDIAEADNVALLIGNTVLSSDYVFVRDGKVTVSKDLMQQLQVGDYSIDLVFDDKNYTTVKEAIKLHAYNTHPQEAENSDADE